ncbi:MAG: hypothetical protein SGILL_006249, partial [Bacillariaceae sp.]
MGSSTSLPDPSNTAREDDLFLADAAGLMAVEEVILHEQQQEQEQQSCASSQQTAGGGLEFTDMDHGGKEHGDSSGNNNHNHQQLQYSRRRSSHMPSRMQQVDANQGGRRFSQLRRQSFIVEFAQSKGPPQIAFLMMLVAIGAG